MQQNNFLFLYKTATPKGAAGQSSGDTGSCTALLCFASGGSAKEHLGAEHLVILMRESCGGKPQQPGVKKETKGC